MCNKNNLPFTCNGTSVKRKHSKILITVTRNDSKIYFHSKNLIKILIN